MALCKRFASFVERRVDVVQKSYLFINTHVKFK